MSTIAAGTTSGTALVSTGNTDGTIQLQVNGTTPSVTLATTGAIGVGSTPGYGTSGQVLTSGGSAAAPSWATAASGLTYISTTTISSAATTFAITSGFSSTYDEYVMNFYNVTFSGETALNYRLYLASVLYTASDYMFQTTGGSGGTSGSEGGNGEANVRCQRTSVDAATGVVAGNINFYNINNTTNKQSVISFVSGTSSGATAAWNNIATCGARLKAGSAVITGIQFGNSNGANFLTGTFKLYGVQKA
jgi:hypothetical protein